MADLAEAEARLRAELSALPGAVIAFSGGVDSSVLLAAALECLGPQRVIAVLAEGPSLARREAEEARAVAADLGATLLVLATDEAEDPRYSANRGDRCYWCKEALFRAAEPVARARGWSLCYGENADDVAEDRPGARSAAERGVRAPLRDAGWSKELVRAFARARGLRVADKPAAPCLASRLPVGVAVSRERLARVEALEEALRVRGFEILRARHVSDEHAVIEVADEELARARALEPLLRADAALCGYRAMDLRAYRRGAAAQAAETAPA